MRKNMMALIALLIAFYMVFQIPIGAFAEETEETVGEGSDSSDGDGTDALWTVTFSGNEYASQNSEGDESSGTFELDTEADPKEIDFFVEESNEAREDSEEVVVLGIYTLEDDLFTLSINTEGGERPTSFEEAFTLYLYAVETSDGDTELEGTWEGYGIDYGEDDDETPDDDDDETPDDDDDETPDDDDDETHDDDDDDMDGSDNPDEMEMLIDMPKVNIMEWTMTSKYSGDYADEMRRKIDADEDDEVTSEEIETLQESVSDASDDNVGMDFTIDGHSASKTTMDLKFKGAEGDVFSGEPLEIDNTIRSTFDDVDTKKDRHTIDFDGEDEEEGDDDEVKEPEGTGDEDRDEASDGGGEDDARETRVDDEAEEEFEVNEDDFEDSPGFSKVVFNAPSGWSIDPDTVPSYLKPYLSKDKGSFIIEGDDFEEIEEEGAPVFDIVEGEIEDDGDDGDDKQDEEEVLAETTESMEEGAEETVDVGDLEFDVTVEEVNEEDGTVTFSVGEEEDITLEVGEKKKIDTDGDGEFDTEVELEQIKDGEAKLKFTELETEVEDEDEDTPGFSSALLIIALGLVGVAMLFPRRERK